MRYYFDGDVTVVAVEMHGSHSATLTYRTSDGRLGERIITADELAAEVQELEGLVELADGVRSSGEGTKWVQLRELLRSEHFAPADGGADPHGGAEPEVRYLLRPFEGVSMHEAQTSVPLRVADLVASSVPPG